MTSAPLLIVGQGLAGTLLSHALHKRGLNFRVIDPCKAHSASIIAAGMWNPIVFRRMNLSWQAEKLLPQLYSTYTELEKLLQVRLIHEKDIVKPFPNEAFADLFKKRLNDAEFVDYLELWPEEKLPGGIDIPFGAGIIKKCGYVDMPMLISKWRDYLDQYNLLIRDEFSHHKVNFTDLGLLYEGELYSRIIFCEGYKNQSNPWFSYLPMKHVKGEVLSAFTDNLPFDFVLNNQSFLMPINQSDFKMGATYNWDELDEVPTEHGKAEIIDRLLQFIPFKFEIKEHKAGIRPAVSDRRPLLGYHPEIAGLSIFNGLGTKGVMIGPYYANHFADVILGSEEIDEEVNIRRFVKNTGAISN